MTKWSACSAVKGIDLISEKISLVCIGMNNNVLVSVWINNFWEDNFAYLAFLLREAIMTYLWNEQRRKLFLQHTAAIVLYMICFERPKNTDTCILRYGEVEEMNVCDNLGDHLVGNVYIKFRTEEDAAKAVADLNTRWFGARPIYAELSPVTDFREACCRKYLN